MLRDRPGIKCVEPADNIVDVLSDLNWYSNAVRWTSTYYIGSKYSYCVFYRAFDQFIVTVYHIGQFYDIVTYGIDIATGTVT